MATTTTSFLHSFKLLGLTLFLIVSYQTSQAQIDSSHFLTTWLTSMKCSSNSQSITLFTDANYSYNYDVDWDNDGVFEDTNVRGNITHQYPTAGRYTIRIKGIFPRIYFGDSTNSSAWLTDRKKLLFIDQWGTQQWKNLAHAFNGCENMSVRAIDTPNLDSVKNISYLFANINGTFHSLISNWNVSQVTNMEGVFKNAITFNEPIGAWQVDSVKTMESLFEGATAFNQPIGNWQVDSVKNMRKMFHRAYFFNQAIGNWDVNNVTTMLYMFWMATSFNQPIGDWDVSNVKNMWGMFSRAFAFNQPIGNWDVSNVSNMLGMFHGAIAFNQPIGNWNVSSVTDMVLMFSDAVTFNQPIGNWDVSNVQSIRHMFENTRVFDQDISSWDVSSINDMHRMFCNAKSFNQNLGKWNISNVGIMRNIFDSSGLSTTNYDSTIISWQTKPHPANLTFGAANLSYCASDSVRNLLITNSGWTFVGDTLNCVTVGVDNSQITKSNFKIYPNPTQGQIALASSAENRNVPLFIYNTQGQKVKSIRLEIQSQAIDLSDLPAGLYFVVHGESRQKLVLEK